MQPERGAGGAPEQGGRVVVGVDDSPGSDRALRWAVAEAAAHGREVHAVLAWELPTIGAFGIDPQPVDFDALAEGAAQVLARVLARVEDEAREQGVTVTGEVVHGHPRHVLLECAGDADLLVVGSRGMGGVKGLLLGSVSSYCATHAPVPVAVVPAPVEP
ncbi:MAG: universal stress protein [Acidimicrobiales bacterium]|nr:universal stress protein [Acidimicrobiales bacterium]MCB9373082.1 universal stress protein [Microthrixaceae bacterium]